MHVIVMIRFHHKLNMCSVVSITYLGIKSTKFWLYSSFYHHFKFGLTNSNAILPLNASSEHYSHRIFKAECNNLLLRESNSRNQTKYSMKITLLLQEGAFSFSKMNWKICHWIFSKTLCVLNVSWPLTCWLGSFYSK